MILACESCGENRRHYERFIGRIDTLEERRELVCSECDAITLVEQTLAPVIHINFNCHTRTTRRDEESLREAARLIAVPFKA